MSAWLALGLFYAGCGVAVLVLFTTARHQPAPAAPAVDPVDEAFRTAAALLAPYALDAEPTPFADRIEADLRAVTVRPATPPKES